MKKLLSFLFICGVALSATAYSFEVDGTFYSLTSSSAPLPQRVAAFDAAVPGFTSLVIAPFGIEKGTTAATVTLDLQNPNDEFTAFECSIRLPEGIDWATKKDRNGNVVYVQPTFNTAANRTDADYHTLSAVKKMDDGTFKLICYSMEKEVFLYSEGALLDLPLIFAEDLAEGICEIEIEDIVLTRKNVTDVKPTDYKTSVFVGDLSFISEVPALYGYYTADGVKAFNTFFASNTVATFFDFTNATGFDAEAALSPGNKNALFLASADAVPANESNVIVNGVCENLVLTDGFAFDAAQTFTVKAGEYGRTLSADEYATIVLPFVPDAETLKGFTFYELTDVEENALTFDEVSSPVAGKPYIVTSNGATKKMRAKAESEVAIEAATTEADGWTMTGTYESVVFTDAHELANLYCISGNQFKQATSKLTMNPFRAYFVGDGSAKSITLRGDDGSTNIISLDSQFSILNSPLYDLLGRQVEHPAQDGIYIQNSKKVLVK